MSPVSLYLFVFFSEDFCKRFEALPQFFEAMLCIYYAAYGAGELHFFQFTGDPILSRFICVSTISHGSLRKFLGLKSYWSNESNKKKPRDVALVITAD